MCRWNKKIDGNLILVIALFLCISGCGPIKAKQTQHPYATDQTKKELLEDLESGKLKVGSELEHIMSTYGEPANITDQDEKVLLIYRRPAYEESIYLWFNDGEHLSSWSK